MKRVWLVMLWVACSACQSSNYLTPTLPAPVNPTAPYTINLWVVVGAGATANQATITAGVQASTGLPVVGVQVAFATTQGTLTPTAVVTDSNGMAVTTLVSSVAAQVTATAGNVSVQRDVNTQPPH